MILFVTPFLLMYKVFYLLFCIFADICDFLSYTMCFLSAVLLYFW